MEYAMNRLAPRGASGLKLDILKDAGITKESRPARGEWIEIRAENEEYVEQLVSPREGRVD